MSIKAGQLITEGNGFLASRVQTDGISNFNIPEEEIHELGNFKTVANIRDIPDLSWDVESFDTSTYFEAMITGVNPTTTVDHQAFNLDDAKPLDITAPFKKKTGIFTIYKGMIVPYLTLEQSVYRFGLRASATQQHTLKGDSVYFIPGSPYYQEFAFSGIGPYTMTNSAISYVEGADTLRVLGLCWVAPDGTFKRLFHGNDYTDNATTFTLTSAANALVPVGSTLRAVYGSTTVRTFLQSVHPSTTVLPAAVRPKNIDLYVGTNAATPVFTRWAGVQNFELTRRVDLQNDEEFGNVHYVSQDFDVPTVSGSVTLKPVDLDEMYARIAEIAGVATNVVAGPNSAVTVPIELRVSHPDTGAVLKTFYVPDAKLTPPAVQGRVQQRIEFPVPFKSETGSLLIYKGTR